MTASPALITGLTYKGTDLQDWPRLLFEISEGGPGASPEVRGGNLIIPYRRGQLYAPKRANRLAIGLTGILTGVGVTVDEQIADVAAARAELAELFDAEGGEGALSATTEDSTVWTANAYPEVFIPDFQPRSPIHQVVSVRLIAIDPPNWVAEGS